MQFMQFLVPLPKMFYKMFYKMFHKNVPRGTIGVEQWNVDNFVDKMWITFDSL